MTALPPTARAVLLDRDGTLVDVVRDEETGTVTTAFAPGQLRLLDGVVEGLLALHRAGFVLAVATNQPGPAKGHFSTTAVERTNAALVELLATRGVPIAAVRACMHHPKGGPGGDPTLVGPCACRKPAAGMLDELARELGFDRGASWMVGDSAGDVAAGARAGMRTALLLPHGRCELCPLRGEPPLAARPDLVGATLDELARAIVSASARAPARP